MIRRPLLGLAGALLLTAAPAQAATDTLTAPRAAKRDCTQPAPGRTGVTTTRFVAPADGTVRAGLGARSGDWDLAAFDRDGGLIAGSSAFRANELIEVHLTRGARITLQACRVAGRSRAATLRTGFTRVDFDDLRLEGRIQRVRVPVTAQWQTQLLDRLGFDVMHSGHDGHAELMLYGDRDVERLMQTGMGFDVEDPDVRASSLAARRQDRAYARRVGRSPLPSGRTEYRTYEDVQKELKEMAAQYPSLVRPFTLKTKTFEGRDIQALEIGQGAPSADDTRPVLFLNGIHHAREWPATEVIMEFAWDLLKNHGSDRRLGEILKNVRVVMQPYTNVDGFLVSRAALGQPEDVDSDAGYVYRLTTGVVILGGSFGYKRKNCNPYPVPDGNQPCEINIGTDNNRNYPHTWGGRGASTNPNDQSYRGSGPGSEPETAAVQGLHLSLNAPVLLSMHNIAAKVLRPPGTKAEGFSPDEEGLKELGRRMAEPAGYKNEYGWQLYDVTGGTKDWAYATTGSYGYTIETGPANGDFHGDYQEVVVDQYVGSGERAGRGFREALIAAAEWTRNEKYTSRIAGRAPAGRTLRITKEFKTLSSPVCTVSGINPTTAPTPDECMAEGAVIETPEKLDITTEVPASGEFVWWLNPSTRPYAKSPETYHLTCEADGKVLEEKDVVLARGETLRLDLPCGGALPAAGGGEPSAGSPPSGGAPGRPSLVVTKAARRGAKAVRVGLRADGGTLTKVTVALLKGRRTIARTRVASLTGRRTITLRSKRKLRRGTYTVRAAANGALATRRLKVR